MATPIKRRSQRRKTAVAKAVADEKIYAKKGDRLYQVEQGWIETYSGQRFDFHDPKPEQVHLEDVAHALSLLCRYNGHTQRFYSVAEHSVHIADRIRADGYKAQVQLTGLLHDAAEYIIGDMARPIKVTMPQFKEAEIIIDKVVAERFGTLYPFPDIIKELDTRILCDERDQAMSQSKNMWGVDGLEPIGCRLQFWSPEKAKAKFLERFRIISSELM